MIDGSGAYVDYSKSCLINPATSRVLRPWDCFVVVVLLFVVFATPYEVAFLNNSRTPIFYVGVACDFVFFLDMVLTFLQPVKLRGHDHNMVITSHKLIAIQYLKGWFFVDLVCVLPYGIISELLIELFTNPSIRAVRLLRLLKLMRVTKARRLFHRYRASIGLPFRQLTLFLLFFSVIIAAHWLSCLLGFLGFADGDVCVGAIDEFYTIDEEEGCQRTWASQGLHDMGSTGSVTRLDTYLLSLHTAMTMLVHPHAHSPRTRTELYVFVVLMFGSGFLWTRVISKSTAMFSSMDRHRIQYHQMMDDLKTTCQLKMFPEWFQQDLRKYFLNLEESPEEKTWRELQMSMSPMLRRETQRYLNRHWLLKVRYLMKCSPPLIAACSSVLDHRLLAQNETMGELFHLYILSKGLVQKYRDTVKDGSPVFKMMNVGAVWGDEHMLLTQPHLLQPTAVMTLTFCEILALNRDDFDQVVNAFPDDHPRLHKLYLRYCFIYGFLWYAQHLRRQKPRRSQEEASGKLGALETKASGGTLLSSISQASEGKKMEINSDEKGGYASSRSVLQAEKEVSNNGEYWSSMKKSFGDQLVSPPSTRMNRVQSLGGRTEGEEELHTAHDHALVLQRLCNAYATTPSRQRAKWQLPPERVETTLLREISRYSLPGETQRRVNSHGSHSDLQSTPKSPTAIAPSRYRLEQHDGVVNGNGTWSDFRPPQLLSGRVSAQLPTQQEYGTPLGSLEEFKQEVNGSIHGLHMRVDRLSADVHKAHTELIAEIRLLRQDVQKRAAGGRECASDDGHPFDSV